MDRMEAAGLEPPLDRPALESESEHFFAADDPMLPVRQFGERSLPPTCLSLMRHIGPKLRNVLESPRC